MSFRSTCRRSGSAKAISRCWSIISLKKFNRHNDKEIQGIEPEVIEVFMNYYWPGNIRELENVIERMVHPG